MIQRKNIRQAEIELVISYEARKNLLESSKNILGGASKSDGRKNYHSQGKGMFQNNALKRHYTKPL
jgi:hypothetical protein